MYSLLSLTVVRAKIDITGFDIEHFEDQSNISSIAPRIVTGEVSRIINLKKLNLMKTIKEKVDVSTGSIIQLVTF